jgi:hypothetical protein
MNQSKRDKKIAGALQIVSSLGLLLMGVGSQYTSSDIQMMIAIRWGFTIAGFLLFAAFSYWALSKL